MEQPPQLNPAGPHLTGWGHGRRLFLIYSASTHFLIVQHALGQAVTLSAQEATNRVSTHTTRLPGLFSALLSKPLLQSHARLWLIMSRLSAQPKGEEGVSAHITIERVYRCCPSRTSTDLTATQNHS